MKSKRPTSSEVARYAGVSRSTVSFVLNGVEKANISAATKIRVLEAAKKLGYVPDAAASALASGRTRTLGLVICHGKHLQVDAFIPRALYAINQRAHAHGFKVIVETVEDPTQPNAYLNLTRGKLVDGLIVLNPRHYDGGLRELSQEGYPLVVLGVSDLPQALFVSSLSNVEAAEQATRHLTGLGHERIVHVSYGSFQYGRAAERLQGYRQALESAELPFDAALVREGDYSAESGYRAVLSLLDERTSFTALFASNDTVALGAMAALYARGLKIPEDVAVVGYDDIPMAAYAIPPLTTMRSPALEHGRRAVDLLVALLRGESADSSAVEPALELIIRKSCGAGWLPPPSVSPQALT